MKKAVIFDLDGTLADVSHRVHLAQSKQWEEFNKLAHLDDPILPVVKLLKQVSQVSKAIILTGRDHKFVSQTMDWLFEHDISPHIHDLIMRPTDNYTPDYELKLNMLEIYFGGKEKVIDSVWFVVEDRDRNVEVMRNYGLMVIQPCAGAY